jgi:hypothetical protein
VIIYASNTKSRNSEDKTMKRYLMSIMIVILIIISVLLAGCTQDAKMENRIASLEIKLEVAELNITVLQDRIEQLEKESLTEVDILKALAGTTFNAVIYGIPDYPFGRKGGIKINYFVDVDTSLPIE